MKEGKKEARKDGWRKLRKKQRKVEGRKRMKAFKEREEEGCK